MKIIKSFLLRAFIALVVVLAVWVFAIACAFGCLGILGWWVLRPHDFDHLKSA